MPVENLEPVDGLLDDTAVNANIRKVVKLLLFINDMTPEQLGEQMPLKRSTLYTRLKESGVPTRFTAAELYRMGHIFGVPVAKFYEKPTIGYMWKDAAEGPVLSLIAGSNVPIQGTLFRAPLARV